MSGAMAITKAQALDCPRKFGKVDIGGQFIYGSFLDVHSSGAYVKFQRGRAGQFKPKWYHRERAWVHHEPCLALAFTSHRNPQPYDRAFLAARIGMRVSIQMAENISTDVVIESLHPTEDWVCMQQSWSGRLSWWRFDAVFPAVDRSKN